jgi:HEAT repeat protein
MTIEPAVLKTLSDILLNGVDIHRCAAATALGRLGVPDAVEPLIDALRDEDEDVRTDAATALAGLRDGRAAVSLLENLIEDPCGDVKTAALETLSRMRSPDLIPWLRRIVRGRDEEIAWDDDALDAGGWDDWVDLQVKAIEALGELAIEDAVGDIVAAMGDEMGQDLTDVGLRALVRLGDSGIDAAIEMLDTPDARLRRRVVVCFAGVDSPAAEAAVVGALSDSSIDVRIEAVQALASRDPSRPALLALFDDPSPAMRAAVVRHCGPAASDRLLTALADESQEVRRAVLDLIAREPSLLPAETVVPLATAMLGGEAPKSAATAAAAIAALGGEAAAETLSAQALDPSRPAMVRLAALAGLIQLGDKTVFDVLAASASDGDRQVRLQALAGLAGLAAAPAPWPNDAADTLLGVLATEIVDEAPSAEMSSVEPSDADAQEPVPASEAPVDPGAEAEIAAPPPVSTLEAILGADSLELKVLKDGGEKVELSPKDLEFLGLTERKLKKRKLSPISTVAAPVDSRRFAAQVLGDVGRVEVAAALFSKIGDDDSELAINALVSLVRLAEVLGTLPDSVTTGLVAILETRDANRRLLALRALAHAGGDCAVEALIAALSDGDSFLRLEAVRALARAGRVDRERMGDMLADGDASVRLAAAEALADSEGMAGSDGLADKGDPSTVDRLTDFSFAFEGYHHRETARLLRRVDPAAASRRYLKVLGEEDRRREWQVAIAALGELNEPEATATS